MSVRFLKNRKTGIVFAWNAALLRHPDVEEISAEEALSILQRNIERRETIDRVRQAVASPGEALARIKKLASESEPTPPALDAKPEKKAAKKPSKKSVDSLGA